LVLDNGSRRISKAIVQNYRTELEECGLSASAVNVQLAAIRKLASEAADNGLLPPELAAGIARSRAREAKGPRQGTGSPGTRPASCYPCRIPEL
jgi:hypothetical protein